MNNKKKYILISILIVAIISVVVAIILIYNKGNTLDNNTNQDNNTEVLDNSKYDELKNSVGKGHSKDVVDVKQDKDENGNRTYTYITANGDSTTIVIRKKTDEDDASGIDDPPEVIDIDDDGDDKQDDEPSQEELGTAYEVFMNMDAKEQSAFYKSFTNPDDFYDWFDAAEAEYNKLHPTIVVNEDEIIDVEN